MCSNSGDPDIQTSIELLAELKALRPNREKYIQSAVELTAGVVEGFEKVRALIATQTAMIDTLKNRQAVASIAQALSLTIIVLWLVFLAARAIWVCVTKKQQANQEEMVEMLEASLARRKAKCRAIGKQICETNK